MPKEDDVTSEPARSEVRILRANNVEIPISPAPVGSAPSDPETQEYLKLRSAFFAGEKLSTEDLNKVMLRSVESASGGGGNGNCGIC